MATLQFPPNRTNDTHGKLPFTPEQFRRMTQDDIVAGKTLSLLLGGVIVLGTLLGAIAVLCTL